jgi:hypothetical protein
MTEFAKEFGIRRGAIPLIEQIKKARVGWPALGFVLAFLIGFAPVEVRAWTDEIFAAFLKQGGWHEKVDDNVKGENLSPDLIRQIVSKYQAQPNDPNALQDLGLFALAMGIAEWGVADPAGLPPDPAGKNWASDTGPDSGKHLMSYAVGGIGISHADVGDLGKFIRLVADDASLVPAEHRRALLRLANTGLYRRGAVIYDEIRAAGVCAHQKFDIDLNGERFNHFANIGAGGNYCAKYKNQKLNASDWRLFRTWMRAALRAKSKQEWLASLWLEKYWNISLNKVPSGPGYIEEVLVNVRIRNSAPAVANTAMTRPAATVVERVQRELDAYGKFSMKTLKRRCRLMLRPVVLYRHFAGEPPLQGIKCPLGSA